MTPNRPASVTKIVSKKRAAALIFARVVRASLQKIAAFQTVNRQRRDYPMGVAASAEAVLQCAKGKRRAVMTDAETHATHASQARIRTAVSPSATTKLLARLTGATVFVPPATPSRIPCAAFRIALARVMVRPMDVAVCVPHVTPAPIPTAACRIVRIRNRTIQTDAVVFAWPVILRRTRTAVSPIARENRRVPPADVGRHVYSTICQTPATT